MEANHLELESAFSLQQLNHYALVKLFLLPRNDIMYLIFCSTAKLNRVIVFNTINRLFELSKVAKFWAAVSQCDHESITFYDLRTSKHHPRGKTTNYTMHATDYDLQLINDFLAHPNRVIKLTLCW